MTKDELIYSFIEICKIGTRSLYENNTVVKSGIYTFILRENGLSRFKINEKDFDLSICILSHEEVVELKAIA